MNEWMKNIWYSYMIEFYSVIMKNEIMSFVGKWMELEIIILSKISQSLKDKYHIFSLICEI
jgi:hypothetical protein